MTAPEQFRKWLASLGGLRADLPVSECVRGFAVQHTLAWPGDMTTATLEGSVKSFPNVEPELAVFTIGAPVFAEGETTWTFSLTGEQTGALPSTGSGVSYFVYDLLITFPGGVPQRIAGGLFPVSGFVTEAV